MSEEKIGIERAIDTAGGGAEGCKAVAQLLGTSVQFIYNSRRKGYLPIDRARVIADTYGVPLADLVRADVREALRNS